MSNIVTPNQISIKFKAKRWRTKNERERSFESRERCANGVGYRCGYWGEEIRRGREKALKDEGRHAKIEIK